jgi:hypothetical protein
MYPTAAELLPTWWRAICVVLLLGVVVVLGLGAARTTGAARWWHAIYAVVAAARSSCTPRTRWTPRASTPPR